MKKILLSVLVATAFAGCVERGDVGVGYSYGYAAPPPEMYVMGDGVSVVAYSDYPTFYSDDYYWMYNGGVWYRSSYYGGGWAVAYDVPYRVRGIREPVGYAHYTPGNGWARSYPRGYNARTNYSSGGTVVRDQRSGGGGYSPSPVVRDHRSYSAPAPAPRSGGGGPVVRDHRRH